MSTRIIRAPSPKRRVLCPRLPRGGERYALPPEEARHLIHVLRLSDGDRVLAMDGEGASCVCQITRTQGQVFLVRDDSGAPPKKESGSVVPCTFAVGVLKNDTFSWVIEKLVELGITRLIPLACERTIVRGLTKDSSRFITRWQKIADQTLKQCGRDLRLQIAPPITPEGFMKTALAQADHWLWCDETSVDDPAPRMESLLSSPSSSAQPPTWGVLIGPEGGWSSAEQKRFSQETTPRITRVGLGPWVLRAETAAIAAAAILAHRFWNQPSVDKPSRAPLT